MTSVLTFADNALIVAYLEGDEYAFQILVDRYQDRLVNYIHNLIHDYDQAVDLSQETFVRVFRHAHRYEGKYQFSTWGTFSSARLLAPGCGGFSTRSPHPTS